MRSKHTSSTTQGEWDLAGANLKGKMTIYQAAPALLHVKINVPGIGEMQQGFNGKIGWTINPMQGAMLASGKELEQAKRDATFNLLAHMMKSYKSATTKKVTTFGGEECYQVELVTPSDDVSQAFYSKKTGLFRGMTMKAATPLGEIETSSTYSDYKEFGGVKIATVQVVSAMGQTQTLTFKNITFNDVDKSTAFALPAKIETLVKAQDAAKEKAADKPGS